jgi:hypothetical protein
LNEEVIFILPISYNWDKSEKTNVGKTKI